MSIQLFNSWHIIALSIFPQESEWRQWHPTPVLLPGESHGRRSLAGCSPRGCKESDKTEQLHFHFLLSCIGEGYGNPVQCSCLENPWDGGAWWAAVYGVAQSRTRLKRLSSSSSRMTVSVQEACAYVQFHLQFLMCAPAYNISILMYMQAACPHSHRQENTPCL